MNNNYDSDDNAFNNRSKNNITMEQQYINDNNEALDG